MAAVRGTASRAPIKPPRMSVQINTDNMTFAGVDLEAEYDHCLREMGFTPEDLVKMSENSIRAAFLSEEKRLALLSLLDQKQ